MTPEEVLKKELENSRLKIEARREARREFLPVRFITAKYKISVYYIRNSRVKKPPLPEDRIFWTTAWNGTVSDKAESGRW